MIRVGSRTAAAAVVIAVNQLLPGAPQHLVICYLKSTNRIESADKATSYRCNCLSIASTEIYYYHLFSPEARNRGSDTSCHYL